MANIPTVLTTDMYILCNMNIHAYVNAGINADDTTYCRGLEFVVYVMQWPVYISPTKWLT